MFIPQCGFLPFDVAPQLFSYLIFRLASSAVQNLLYKHDPSVLVFRNCVCRLPVYSF